MGLQYSQGTPESSSHSNSAMNKFELQVQEGKGNNGGDTRLVRPSESPPSPTYSYQLATKIITNKEVKEKIRKREPTGFVGSGAHSRAEAAAKGLHMARLR